MEKINPTKYIGCIICKIEKCRAYNIIRVVGQGKNSEISLKKLEKEIQSL